MLNFKHLQYFNAVYQYKNFTQAGDSLFVSQPTISAAINTLESELGVKLIERSPKNVIFTYEGEQFILWVRKILSLCQEAETAMHDLSDSAEQHLRLGMSYAFMDSAAPPVFSDFLDEHPKAQIHLEEGSMQKLLRMVHEEQLDLPGPERRTGTAGSGLQRHPRCYGLHRPGGHPHQQGGDPCRAASRSSAG